ncbi:MAG: SDR family oxidoreductase [bacterium]|nr:SDR family oxidoreductase [bacterium]
MIQTISILGCGWLGLPLGQTLAQAGYTVKGSTTTTDKLLTLTEAGISPFLIKAGDQLEGDNLRDFFQTDLLFVNIPPGGRRDPNVEETYPRKVKAIVEMAMRMEVPELIFVSSTGVYGNDNTTLDESAALNPSTASGRALVVIERYLQLLRAPRPTVLRMGGLVGGSRKPGRFLAGKKDIPNGEAPVNLVHLDDCIGLIASLIEQEAFGHTLNVVADGHPTRAAFYTAQAEKEGLEPPTFKGNKELAYKIISNEWAKELLAYTFRHPDPMNF